MARYSLLLVAWFVCSVRNSPIEFSQYSSQNASETVQLNRVNHSDGLNLDSFGLDQQYTVHIKLPFLFDSTQTLAPRSNETSIEEQKSSADSNLDDEFMTNSEEERYLSATELPNTSDERLQQGSNMNNSRALINIPLVRKKCAAGQKRTRAGFCRMIIRKSG